MSRVAPTCPSAEPSTEASTSVFSDGRPSKTRASCSSAAVSDGAAGGVRYARGVAVGHHDDLAAALARAAADHVHQLLLVALEPVHLDGEAALAERVGHQPGGAAVARGARAAVRSGVHDPLRLGLRGGALEHHIGGQALLQRPADCSATRT